MFKSVDRNCSGFPPYFIDEVVFRTARSGGKGGQNVNKVETMVEGYWNVAESNAVDEVQKAIILQKLANRINSEGLLLVKSQESRSQLANKQRVKEKMLQLVAQALIPKVPRIATKPSKAAKARRLESKKLNSKLKQSRQKVSEKY